MAARSALFFASLLLASTAASAQTTPAPAPAADAASQSADARLRQLFHDSDEDNLRRNPIQGVFRGDYRYAAHLGDYISDAYFAAERAAAERELATLRAIDRDALNATDRIAYDVFRWQRENDLADVQPAILALTAVRPLNHFSGFQVFYPVFASGHGAAPFRNVEDYENNLTRHREYAVAIDRAIGRFRQGLASGVVETKLTIRNVIDQLDAQLHDAPEASPFYGPAQNFPGGVPEADRARLRAELLTVIRDEIFPAYHRLRDF